jgi:serine/threonine protein phosphatase PrpC
METLTTTLLDWGVAELARADGEASGDVFVVEPFADGTLVAVVDGLGHGPEASAVAQRAATVLRRHAHEPIAALVRRCHEALRQTRGAVLGVASFSAHEPSMSWVGVGNVEGRLLRAVPNGRPEGEALLQHAGTLGDRLPPLTVLTVPIHPGDTLVFTTDGVHHDFADAVRAPNAPQEIAERILHQHARGTDDALVLVARRREIVP